MTPVKMMVDTCGKGAGEPRGQGSRGAREQGSKGAGDLSLSVDHEKG